MLNIELENSISSNLNHTFLSINDKNKKLFCISKKTEKNKRDLNNKNIFLMKKYDKPIRKNNIKGRWTKEEQILFVDMILALDNDWKKMEKQFTTRTIVQIRSHAQKFLIKLKSNSYLRKKGLQKSFSWKKTICFLKSILTIDEIKHIFYSLCEDKKKKKDRKIKYDENSNSNLNDSSISNEKSMNLITDENNNIDNDSENDEGIFDEYLFDKIDFDNYTKRIEYYKNQNKYIEKFIKNFNYNTISDNNELNEKFGLFI